MATLIPWHFTTPSSDGNAFPYVLASTTRQLYYACLKDVSARWHFRGMVPLDYGSSPSIKVAYVANATSGVTRLNVEYASVSDGDDADPTLTSLTAQNVTVPGTAYLLDVVAFTGATLTAGDVVHGAVFHDGTNGSDTLAVDTLIAAVWLEYTAA